MKTHDLIRKLLYLSKNDPEVHAVPVVFVDGEQGLFTRTSCECQIDRSDPENVRLKIIIFHDSEDERDIPIG